MDTLISKWCCFTIRNATVPGHERHVQLSPSDRADMFITTAISDVDRDFRILYGVAANQFAQEAARERGKYSDAHHADLGAASGSSCLVCQLKLLKRWPSLTQQTPSGVG